MKKPIILTVIAVGLLISGGIMAPRLTSTADNSDHANICGIDLDGTTTPCPVIADPAPPPPETPAPQTPGETLTPLVTPPAPNCH